MCAAQSILRKTIMRDGGREKKRGSIVNTFILARSVLQP